MLKSFSILAGIEIPKILLIEIRSSTHHKDINEMGLSFSCPFADFDDLDRGLQAVLVRSISFNGRDSEPTIMRTFSSGKMILQGSLSLKGRELETTISIKAPSSGKENKVLVRSVSFKSRVIEEPLKRPDDSSDKTRSMDSGNQRNQAALKLQKVYKSFRTRRQLADCAVLVEQRWFVHYYLKQNHLMTSIYIFFIGLEKLEYAYTCRCVCIIMNHIILHTFLVVNIPYRRVCTFSVFISPLNAHLM